MISNGSKKSSRTLNGGSSLPTTRPGIPMDTSAPCTRELAVSRILYARDEDFRELKKRAEAYPSVLRDSLTQFFMFEAGFSLMLARANAGSGDRYYVAGHIFRAVSCLNQVLFALNDTYCINEKRPSG